MQRIDSRTGKPVPFRFTEALEADLQEHYVSDCDHPQKGRRTYYTANDAKQVFETCLTCGKKFGTALKQDSSNADPDADLSVFDIWVSNRKLAREQIFHKHIDIQEKERNEYRTWYYSYLQSDEWKSKRRLVLKRANYVCEGCAQEKATQVHHLTYDHAGDELLFELVAVCDACHERCHIDYFEESRSEDVDLDV